MPRRICRTRRGTRPRRSTSSTSRSRPWNRWSERRWWADVRRADAVVRPELLARHVYELARHALEAIPGDDETRATRQGSPSRTGWSKSSWSPPRRASRLLLEALEDPGLTGRPPRLLARRSPSGRPASSSMHGVTSRSRGRSLTRSRAPTGSTERRALDTLVRLGARVKVSYDVARTRLHAKAWLFHRNSGLHTAYIGSSNLTHTA